MEIIQDLNKPVDDNSVELNNLKREKREEQYPVDPQPKEEKHDAPESSCGCANEQEPCKKKKCCHGVVTVLLIVAVAALYVLHFTGIGSGKSQQSVAAPVVTGDGTLRVAYVNSDTLLAKYEYARDLEQGLLDYKNSQENSYRNQMAQFQKDYNDFLQNGDKLSLSQQQAKENELKQRAERLSTLEAELTMKIQSKQIDENTKLLNAIFGFIKEYNESHQQYDIILRSTFNDSPTLYVNEAMDITQEIIDGLNAEYKKVKK